MLKIERDAQNYFLIDTGSGNTLFRSMVNGVNDQLIIPFDPAAHHYWRVRHDLVTNAVTFETSANAINWTTRKTVTAGFALIAVKFWLIAGAWGTGNATPGAVIYDDFKYFASPTSAPMNVALATNGATASASSTLVNPPFSYPASAVNNGDHKGINAGNGGNWAGSTNILPQWVEIAFNGSRTINEIGVFSLQDDYANPVEPTTSTTFSTYGLTGFDVQYWNGSTWATVPGGIVSGNNKVWKKITFTSITTTKVKVLTNATSDGWSRIVEIEAWTP